MTKILLPLFMLLVMFSSASFAQKIYKWTDSNGVTHYSNQQPKNIQSDSYEEKKKQDGSQSQNNERIDVASNDTNAAESKAKTCESLKDRLNRLTTDANLMLKINGEEVPLDAQMREREISKTNSDIQYFCTN